MKPGVISIPRKVATTTLLLAVLLPCCAAFAATPVQTEKKVLTPDDPPGLPVVDEELKRKIEALGGKFNHGFTRNPVEFLDVPKEWTGGSEGLALLGGLKHTHGLHLRNADLNAEGLAAVAAMPALRDLWVEGVAVSREGFERLAAASQLRSLSIATADQREVRLRGPKSLRNLLVNNSDALTAIDLAGLDGLTSLYISGGARGSSGSNVRFTLDGLPKLQHLHLSGITSTGLRVRDFKSLTGLTLWSIKWSDRSDASLAGLTNLEQVRFAYWDVTDVDLAPLAENRRLASLELESTLVTNDGLKVLRTFPELLHLQLTMGDRVTDGALTHLAGLSKLETMELRGRGFTGEGFGVLKDLSALRHLYLNSTSVDDAGVARLMDVPSLKTASVRNSKASPDVVARLAAVMTARNDSRQK